MKTRDKLQFILNFSELTQAELAVKLNVTFAALNRWINDKATPRKKSLDKIDDLYREYSGENKIPESVLVAKKNAIKNRVRDHKYILQEIINNPDIRDEFLLSLTYNSNRIEGSTLSKEDTAAILFENRTLSNKTLVEQLEAKNHQVALEYLFEYLKKKKSINESLILKLHSILMNGIRSDAGDYRKHGVHIMGTYVPTTNYVKVPEQMRGLTKKINKGGKDTITNIASIHAQFEQIHPFGDGNGRTGRLLMHAMALKSNLAPVTVLQENRKFYMAYLNKAQMLGDFSLLEDFICDCILKGFDILERVVPRR